MPKIAYRCLFAMCWPLAMCPLEFAGSTFVVFTCVNGQLHRQIFSQWSQRSNDKDILENTVDPDQLVSVLNADWYAFR